MNTSIEQRIVRLIESTVGVSRKVRPTSRLVDDLGFDSIMMVELMSAIEDAFDLVITLDEATRIETVSDLQQTVSDALAQRPGEVPHVPA